MNRRQLLKLTALALPVACPNVSGYQTETRQLDPDSKYMVFVRALPGHELPTDWRKLRQIEDEIVDCFEAGGMERNNVGVLFLDGFGIEVVKVG